MFCPNCRSVHTKPGLTSDIAFLCSQTPLSSSFPRDSGVPCWAEVFLTRVQCLRDGSYSTDTALTYPSNWVGVRLYRADLRHVRKHPTHFLSQLSVSAIPAQRSENNIKIQHVIFISYTDSHGSGACTHPQEQEYPPGTASVSELDSNIYISSYKPF